MMQQQKFNSQIRVTIVLQVNPNPKHFLNNDNHRKMLSLQWSSLHNISLILFKNYDAKRRLSENISSVKLWVVLYTYTKCMSAPQWPSSPEAHITDRWSQAWHTTTVALTGLWPGHVASLTNMKVAGQWQKQCSNASLNDLLNWQGWSNSPLTAVMQWYMQLSLLLVLNKVKQQLIQWPDSSLQHLQYV